MVAPYDFNTIPTELDADGVNPRVGRDKVDPDPGHDPNTQVLALEWNLVKKWIPKLVGFVGGEVGPTWNSIRGKLGGGTYMLIEPFNIPIVAMGCNGWQPGGATPTLLTGLRAGYSFALDEGVNPSEIYTGYNFNRAQCPYFSARYTLTGDPNTAFYVRFLDATANKGWGVKFLTAGTKIHGYTRTGGADTETYIGLWVVSTEVLVEMAIIGTHLWVSMNGGTAVDCGAVADNDDVRLEFSAPTGGAAGKTCDVRTGLLLADWTV